jgi:hypothetical protein
MAAKIAERWNYPNFTVQIGVIPAHKEVSGPDLGAGILYYPVSATLSYRAFGRNEPYGSPQRLSEARVLWNTGSQIEIVNPEESGVPFLFVSLKPSLALRDEVPEEFLGIVSAALLQDDWAPAFKDGVREDLEAISAFGSTLRNGAEPSPEVMQVADLAKEDLDVKLLWSAREFRRHGVFTAANLGAALAATTPASGLINVTANTKDKITNAPVSGCAVWYVKRIKHNNPAAYQRFSSFSTPTSESLAVGNYDSWTEKGGLQGPKNLISVSSVSSSQSIDLLAP